MVNLNKTKFYSIRTDTPGYMEHIYADQEGRQLLVATVYETLDGRYKFSCRWRLFSESYNTVADAKHDLFQVIEYNTGSRIDWFDPTNHFTVHDPNENHHSHRQSRN